MKNRKFLYFSILIFFLTFGIIISVTAPPPRHMVDIFLELAFAFQPILWIYFAKQIFKNRPYTKFLFGGCILFFLGGVFEIVEESHFDHYLIDDIEDILILTGIVFISISVYKIALHAKQKIESLSKENKENYIDSIHDSLTNLYNKRYLQSSFTEIFEKNPEIFTSSVCVFLDIDNFKQFNDTFGHEEGDKILRTLGEMICDYKRKGDFAFRYGGEEFLIFFMNTNKTLITNKLELLKEDFKQYCKNNYPDKGFLVSLSIGYTDYSYSEELSDIIHRADKAMYVAKFSGKDRICTH